MEAQPVDGYFQVCHAGKPIYDLERDFGVTADELRWPFALCFDRFPAQVKVR